MPKTALLNWFAEVDDQGNYTSPIESKNKRFTNHIACLTGGRVNVPWLSSDQAFTALTIALWYSLSRW